MIRKVIQQGPSTMMVSLPRKWVDECNIGKGGNVYITTKGSTLELTPIDNRTPKEVTLNIEGIDRTSLFHYIRFLYRNGIDIIHLKFSDLYTHYNRYDESLPVHEAVNIELNRLMGMEILEEGKHSCTLKCMVQENVGDFDQFLTKIFNILNEAYSNMIEIPKDEDDLRVVLNNHDLITRLISYCKRVLNKYGYPDYEKTPHLITMLDSLELIIDILEDSAKKTVHEKRKMTKNIVPSIIKLKALFNSFVNLYYKYDVSKVSAVDIQRLEIIHSIETQSKLLNRDELMIIGELQVISAIIHRTLVPLCMVMSK